MPLAIPVIALVVPVVGLVELSLLLQPARSASGSKAKNHRVDVMSSVPRDAVPCGVVSRGVRRVAEGRAWP